jgi:c-di-GMP-binding flagellar brake protein YcgR
VNEKRQFERVGFDDTVEVELQGRSFRARARDISVGGVYLVTAETAAFGEHVTIKLVLPAIAAKGPRALSAVVRWVRDDGFGVQFGPTGALDTYALAELVARKSHAL